MNDFIPDHCYTVKYASMGDATKSIQRLGRGCFMAKTDVKSAFRIIPIYPSCRLSLSGHTLEQYVLLRPGSCHRVV